MKVLTKEIYVEVPKRRAIVSIHDEVERLVAESGVAEHLLEAHLEFQAPSLHERPAQPERLLVAILRHEGVGQELLQLPAGIVCVQPCPQEPSTCRCTAHPNPLPCSAPDPS